MFSNSTLVELSEQQLDDIAISETDIYTPTTISTLSGQTSPTCNEDGDDILEAFPSAQKKKKKKKPKKSAKAKEAAASLKAKSSDPNDLDGRPPVLCISRNKHWRYISSYHGPWLQLPLELLESLLVLNLDPATLSAVEPRQPPPPPMSNSNSKQRDRGFQGLGDYSPPESPRTSFSALPPAPPFPTPKPGKATPPPIDPGVFRCVTSIRRLIDEAAELSVRASSGLSAIELGSMRGGSSGINNNSPWAAAQSLGINPLGNGNNGRNVAMSAMRVHRLRALAVQKLAQAYKADEIASSVMVMQGGSVFDDVAERVLKVDPNDIDAKYVHFFHEKIPSRQLAESTTTQVLDELIASQPQRLEFYRTRGIVHCFRDEYTQATRDFTYALKEARAVRKAKVAHRNNSSNNNGNSIDSRNGMAGGKGGKKKKSGSNKTNGQAPPNGTSAMLENTVEGPDGEPLLLHPSVLPDAPDPIEPQLLFLRGAAFLQQAVFLIETAILKLEGVEKAPSIDGAELRLCYIEQGKYGGVEIGNPDGPLGKKDGAKLAAYREVLSDPSFKDHVSSLLKKSIRDHEKFLTHFDTLEGLPNFEGRGDLAQRIEYAFLLSESIRPGNHSHYPNPPPGGSISDCQPAMFTTYHPLLVESHFSILICQLMLADFVSLLPTFVRTASLIDGLEGYPVFLPPRSMAQAEFIEVLERLAGGWCNGIQPHSLSVAPCGDSRLAIEAPPSPTPSPSRSSTLSSISPGSSDDDHHIPTSNLQSKVGQSSSSGSSSSRPTPSISGSSSASFDQSQSSSSSFVDPLTSSPSSSPSTSPPPPSPGAPGDALDCARILLAPVYSRQRNRAEKVAGAAGKKDNKKKSLAINIPLHGPRVEIILAWLGAVYLPELDA